MLHAYFDETGMHMSSAIVALGGYIATEQTWSAVEAAWLTILAEVADKGVTHFHLSDCLMNSGEFARCDNPTRNYLVTQLAKILGRYELTPICSAVVRGDWNELVDDSNFFQAFPTPTALCFENLLGELVLWGRKYGGGEKIEPVFAHCDDWITGRGLGEPVPQRYGMNAWYSEELQPISFSHPRDCVPLQAADLFVGLSRRDIEFRAKWQAATPKALDWATGGRFTYGNWFDTEVISLVRDRFNQTGTIYP